jgi:hypothetical protein
MRAALVLSILSLSLTLGGCASATPDRSREQEDRQRWAELGLDVPANRTPVFFDADGKQLPEVELDGFKDGFVHVPAAGDAGSFGLGDWYRFDGARQLPERLTEEPEVVLTRRVGPPEFRGLTRKECSQVRAVLRSSDDAAFDSDLQMLVSSGAPRSILVITYVMFELPRESEPETHRLSRVERALDRLVVASSHDALIAEYFRSHERSSSEGARPDPEAAKNALIDWTLENLGRFAWDAEAKRYQLPGAGGG